MAYQEFNPLERAQMAQLQSNMNDISLFNRDPSRFSNEDKARIFQMAQQMGLNVEAGKRRDKAGFGRQAIAGAGGVLDSMLFGLLKDEWYSDYRTKTAKNVGKTVGTIASLLTPAGLLGAGKGAQAAISGGKAFGATLSGAKGAKAAYGAFKSAKTFKDGADAALKLAKIYGTAAGKGGAKAWSQILSQFGGKKSTAILELAKAMIQTDRGMQSVQNTLYPSRDYAPSPYETMDINGMPQPIQ